jgi:hypothetical protein
MGSLDFLLHLANFTAPALFVALLLAAVGGLVLPKRPAARVLWAQVAINFVAGVAVLGAGLWFFGRDGKMATYVALVAVAATSQWIAGRGWK